MYCCISADILLAEAAAMEGVMTESGVIHEGVGEDGEPARSMGCGGCLPLWAASSTVLASGEQPGGSCGLGTDLLLLVPLVVEEVGLLDCDRLERGGEGEGGDRSSSLSGKNSPITQPTDTSRGTSSSFCDQSEKAKMISWSCFQFTQILSVPGSCKPYQVVSCCIHSSH